MTLGRAVPAPERELQGWWWDLVPALPLLLVGMVGTGPAAQNQQGQVQAVDALAYLLVAVAALSLLLRRRAPTVGLVLCGVAVSVYLAITYPFGPILLTGPAAGYAVATRLPWRSAVAWVAGFVAVTTATAAPHFVSQGAQGWLAYLIWAGTWTAVVAAPGAIGAAVAMRRRSEAGVRAEQARRAASEERLEMAQDVHDGVGHGLAVIALHAGVALHVLDRDPERTRELLTSIRATSRESLDGLRADLEPLRSTGSPAAAARRPAPGLEDMPLLLARMRDGGLVVHDEIERPAAISPDVDAAAYRIVQESLTNVLRHAGQTPAWVRVATRGDAVEIEVHDHGLAEPSLDGAGERTGTGIAGMRQRASALGGTLDAGPAPEGGFVVRARLPIAVPEELGVTPR
ncbi:MAG: sensor histidine kinase [Actinomycetota bacterium]|nr:sensor histidine kinase [Actinomycetota bacterium]